MRNDAGITLPAGYSGTTANARVGPWKGLANPALNTAAATWFVVAVLGQLMMAIYVVVFYGRAAVKGDLAGWNKVLPHGYVPGDSLGNGVVASHLAFVAVVVVSGALQLVPAMRRVAPRFHRWNGRVYLAGALAMSIGGLFMVWTRGAIGDLSQHIAISINAVLVMFFSAMALRHAIARRFDVHRRMALRLFLVVGGVWFFRISLMLWIVANQGPAGFDPETFTGPALTAIAFGQYLVPLAVLELYFRAQTAGTGARLAMAALLAGLTLLTAAGIGSASMIAWLPRL
jgi:hypothetical protein